MRIRVREVHGSPEVTLTATSLADADDLARLTIGVALLNRRNHCLSAILADLEAATKDPETNKESEYVQEARESSPTPET
jgi:hypothetical protein